MPSYPAKPYIVPHDDWFNNNSSNFENEPKVKEIKSKTSIHEFFYRQSHVKVGGSENLIQASLEKKSSEKIIISSLRNSDEKVLPKSEEKYSYSKIPAELISTKKRSFQGKTFYKNLFNKNAFNFKSYLLDLKSAFIKLLSKKRSISNNNP